MNLNNPQSLEGLVRLTTSGSTAKPQAISQPPPLAVVSPSPHHKPQNLADDAMLARELNELTVEEREHVYAEIHGVAKPLEETPELISRSLEALKRDLKRMPWQKTRFYQRALFLKPSMENDDQFYLMFLRADRFDPSQAAHRICKFFQHKNEMFGQGRLVKKITLDDLSEHDMAAYRTCSLISLPHRDQAGRRVWVTDLRVRCAPWKNMVRYLWHKVMVDFNDVETQIQGIVNVLYSVRTDEQILSDPLYWEFMSKGSPMINEALPIRMVALHFAYNKPKLQPVSSFFQMVLGRQNRLRFRTHFGSDLEVRYALLTFGIRLGDVMNAPGSVAKNEKLLGQRRIVEEEERLAASQREETTGVYLYPRPTDVLLGRGRPFQDYPGNISLAHILEGYRDRYDVARERFEKTILAIEIVHIVKQKGIRFLRRTPEGWVPVEDKVARDKIGQTLRTQIGKASALAIGSATFSDSSEYDAHSSALSQQTQSESHSPKMMWTAQQKRMRVINAGSSQGYHE